MFPAPVENQGSWGSCIPAPMCRTPHPALLEVAFPRADFPSCPNYFSPSCLHMPPLCHLGLLDPPLFCHPPNCVEGPATSHRPGVTSLLPTPRDGAAAAPTSLLPWGKSFLPRFPLGSVFLTDNAKKSVCLPRLLQRLWDFSLCHGSCATMRFSRVLCLLISSPGWRS